MSFLRKWISNSARLRSSCVKCRGKYGEHYLQQIYQRKKHINLIKINRFFIGILSVSFVIIIPLEFVLHYSR